MFDAQDKVIEKANAISDQLDAKFDQVLHKLEERQHSTVITIAIVSVAFLAGYIAAL